MNMAYRIGAVVAGLLAGGSVVAMVEWISSRMHPMPAGLTMDDKEGIQTWVSTLPVSAFLMLLVAWGTGSLVGAYVARRISPGRSAQSALTVFGLLTVATIVNLIMLPHPWWLWPAGIGVCLFFGILGMVLAAPGEYVVSTSRTIRASVGKVFETLANIENFSKAIPGIVNVEFLSDKKYGIGTRFRETRMMNGKEAATDLEVTELVENKRIRMVSDAGGTIWDTVFTVEQQGESVLMNMQMDARPHNFPARVVTPMILKMVATFVESDMDSVKTFCEKVG